MEKMVEKWKIKTMIAQQRKTTGEINCINKEQENYESDTVDETDLY